MNSIIPAFPPGLRFAGSVLLMVVLAACNSGGGGETGAAGSGSSSAISTLTSSGSPNPDNAGNSESPSASAVVVPSAGTPPDTPYQNFESPQTHPLRLSPDGSRLFAANTAAGSVSVFQLDNPSSPRLIAEIPVGLEPVSLWPVSNDEVWVVNHVSDSVSVVSVASGMVIDSMPAGDEPADIVFAGKPERAYVSAARSREMRVFDPVSHAQLSSIPLQGEHPRALAVSPDGSKVYVAFALSGNHTTIVGRTASRQPPAEPRIAGLPVAPRVGLIIEASDPEWVPSVLNFTLLDHDVAEISTASQSVARYFDRAGTVNLGLAVNPGSGDVYLANTEARNLVFFLQNLRGHPVDNRITRITTGATPQVTPIDLNPGVNYQQLPNPDALATALAQPTDISFNPDGRFMWVAAFGTDRIAKVDTAGKVLARIEVGNTPGSKVDPLHKRGPRGLALQPNSKRLYVQNRIANSLSVIDTENLTLLTEVPLGRDPSPESVKFGRGFLYDAKLSGNGMSSCASCHVDGGVDNLAWNLGDLNGRMSAVTDPVSGQTFQMHPMKGPMVTQTLQGLKGMGPFHWRGDMPDLNAFNRNFDVLMGGSQLSAADMQRFSDFIDSIVLPPNPNLRLDRQLASNILGGDPHRGLTSFNAVPGPTGFSVACSACHSLPATPFKLQITNAVGDVRAAKVPSLSQVYKKQAFNNASGSVTTLGFGQTQDGWIAAMGGGGVAPFLASWDNGTAPAVGANRSVSSRNASNSLLLADWSTLESRSAAGDNGLLVHGEFDGVLRYYRYSSADGLYRCNAAGVAPLSRSEMLAKAQAGSARFTLLGTAP